jgi:hypothetical protein
MGVVCAAAGLVPTIAVAESPGDAWNLRGPQEASEGRPGTWLDPLRKSREPRLPKDTTEKNPADFDLAEFSRSPARRTARPVGDTRTLQDEVLGSDLNDPAEPMLSDAMEFGGTAHSEIPQQEMLTAESVFANHHSGCEQCETWQVLPKGLIYRTYLAGEKEPRMQFLQMYDTRSKRTVWDAVLGGRVGLLRHGNPHDYNADAFQLDLEGGVFARCLPEEDSTMLEGSDYRVGMYGTWKRERTSYRVGYYHISSHVGDEFLIANPAFNRINYVRDSLLAGVTYELSDITRVYGEIGYALGIEGGAKPLEFQFGAEYTPIAQTSKLGAPFAAVNGHLREDFDFQGGVNVVSGWGWQGLETKRRLRIGLNYYHGPSLQYEFFDRWENLIGGGIWLDY